MNETKRDKLGRLILEKKIVDYYVGGNNYPQVMKKFKISSKRLKYCLDKYGIKRHKPKSWNKGLTKITSDKLNNIYLSRKYFSPRNKKYLNEELIIKLFTKDKKTIKAIAKVFRVSQSTIIERLKNNNINTSRIGKKFSKQHRLNLSKATMKNPNKYWLGKKRSKEDRIKMGIPKIGKKQSEESVIKRIRCGKDHYNYQGGITPITRRRTRGTFWKRIANKIRERDNNTCKSCRLNGGSTKFPVHHIIPFRISKDNSPANLITLCNSCHAKFEHKIKTLGYIKLQSILANRYNYKYSEEGEIILEVNNVA